MPPLLQSKLFLSLEFSAYVADVLRQGFAAVELHHLQIPGNVPHAAERDFTGRAVDVIYGQHALDRINDDERLRSAVRGQNVCYQAAGRSDGGLSWLKRGQRA